MGAGGAASQGDRHIATFVHGHGPVAGVGGGARSDHLGFRSVVLDLAVMAAHSCICTPAPAQDQCSAPRLRRVPVQSMQWFFSGTWYDMSRTSDNYFVIQAITLAAAHPPRSSQDHVHLWR